MVSTGMTFKSGKCYALNYEDFVDFVCAFSSSGLLSSSVDIDCRVYWRHDRNLNLNYRSVRFLESYEYLNSHYGTIDSVSMRYGYFASSGSSCSCCSSDKVVLPKMDHISFCKDSVRAKLLRENFPVEELFNKIQSSMSSRSRTKNIVWTMRICKEDRVKEYFICCERGSETSAGWGFAKVSLMF